MPWSADRGKSNTTDQHAKSGDDLTAPGGNQTLRQRGIKYGSQRSAESPEKTALRQYHLGRISVCGDQKDTEERQRNGKDFFYLRLFLFGNANKERYHNDT